VPPFGGRASIKFNTNIERPDPTGLSNFGKIIMCNEIQYLSHYLYLYYFYLFYSYYLLVFYAELYV